jgi:hypothetical protein
VIQEMFGAKEEEGRKGVLLVTCNVFLTGEMLDPGEEGISVDLRSWCHRMKRGCLRRRKGMGSLLTPNPHCSASLSSC